MGPNVEASAPARATPDQGITLRQAALIAGFGILAMGGTPVAEFSIYQNLVVPGDIGATVANIRANQGLWLTAVFLYLTTFIADVVVAWALYVLLIPVNRSLSLLTAWFRLVYTVIALIGLFKLVTVFRMLETLDYATLFGSDQLHAAVHLLLNGFRYEWTMGMAYVVHYLGPYLLPDADLGFLLVTGFGEVAFMLWLLIRGWSLREPVASPRRAA